MSERRVCRVLGQDRSTQRRIPTGREDEERLTADVVQLARQYGRYGYRKIAELLRTRAGWIVSKRLAAPPSAENFLIMRRSLCFLGWLYDQRRQNGRPNGRL